MEIPKILKFETIKFYSSTSILKLFKLYASLIAVISFQKLLRLSVWIFHPKNHHVSLNIHTQVAFNMNNFISLLSPTRAGQHIRPLTEILMLFCRALSYVLVIFLTVIVFTGSCFIFSYIGFPFFSFLSVLVEGIGDRIGVIKHKREVSSFWHQRKKHKHGRNCWRTKGTLLSKLLWHTC